MTTTPEKPINPAPPPSQWAARETIYKPHPPIKGVVKPRER